MTRSLPLAAAMTAAVLLSACGGDSAPKPEAQAGEEDKFDGALDLRNLAGTVKNPPDEFAVIRRRPLELPKDFAALPPPAPGTVSSRLPDPQAEARAALLSGASDGTVAVAASPSASEAALVAAVGAAEVDPNVVATLDAEQAVYEAEQNQYVLDRLFPGLRRLRGEADPEALRPRDELDRLNQQAGSTAARTARAGQGVAIIPGTVATPVPAPAPLPAAAPATQQRAPAPAPQGAPAANELIYIPE